MSNTNKQRRLVSFEAEFVGLKVKNKTDPNRHPRYRISDENWDIIKELRLKGTKGIVASCNTLDVDPTTVKHLWKKTGDESIFIKNPLFASELQKTYANIKTDLIKDLQKYSPKFPVIKRNIPEDPHLLVVDIADLHVGKLADEFETGDAYDNNIAIQRAHQGLQGLLDKSAGFTIDKVLFIAGNDILHTDNAKRTTTSGTPQDTTEMWHKNFLLAKQLYVDLLEKLISVADVHFVFNPSNHDFTNGFFLADVIKTYFRQCKNITFDCDLQHRKYFSYGKNLIGSTHGDGAKQTDLGPLMAHESPDWSSSVHRYIYTHHVHHKNVKDMIGVTIESVRSASGTDAWHSRNGYTGAPKAVEGFIHHPEHGQIARLSHIFY